MEKIQGLRVRKRQLKYVGEQKESVGMVRRDGVLKM